MDEKKKCPFKPLTYINVDSYYSNGCPSECYTKTYDFNACIKEECMLYDEAHNQCLRKG